MTDDGRIVTIRWDDARQNWPGRLAWIEARIAENRATATERAERERLLAASEQGVYAYRIADDGPRIPL
jgi:hypothetical protein